MSALADKWRKTPVSSVVPAIQPTVGQPTAPLQGYGGDIVPNIANKKISELNNSERQLLYNAQKTRESSVIPNNPFGIKVGTSTKHWVNEGKAKLGPVALDGGQFLIFNDSKSADEAYNELLYGPNYSDLTVDSALRKWSGASVGNVSSVSTAGTGKNAVPATGLSLAARYRKNSPTYTPPKFMSPPTPVEKPAKIGFWDVVKGMPSAALEVYGPLFSGQKIIEEAVKPTLEKVTTIPEVKKGIETLTRETGGLSMLSRIQDVFDPTKTYEEIYENWKKSAGDPNNPVWKKFLFQLGETVPQTAMGVALSFIPGAGVPLAMTYWSTLSAGEQLQETGKVSSITNIGIDVALDSVLGNTIGGLLKVPEKTLLKTMVKGFGVEGGTEVTQDLLKYANDYQMAKTPEAKAQVLEQAKNYFTSGQILMTLGVAGLTGAGIAGGAKILQGAVTPGQVNVPPAEPPGPSGPSGPTQPPPPPPGVPVGQPQPPVTPPVTQPTVTKTPVIDIKNLVGDRKVIAEFFSQFNDPLAEAQKGIMAPFQEGTMGIGGRTRTQEQAIFGENINEAPSPKSDLEFAAADYLRSKGEEVLKINGKEQLNTAVSVVIDFSKKAGYSLQDIAHFIVRNYIPGGAAFLEGNGPRPNLYEFYSQSKKPTPPPPGVSVGQPQPPVTPPVTQPPVVQPVITPEKIFEIQDSNQEKLIHATTWNEPILQVKLSLGENRPPSIRYTLEGTGDIFRETTQVEYIDKNYVTEKLKRLQEYLDFHTQETLNTELREDSKNLQELRKMWVTQPVGTEQQQIAKDLNLAIIDNNIPKVKELINKIKSLDFFITLKPSPKTTPITQPTMVEAKTSGWSFDEWVKGQGILKYHGSPTEITGRIQASSDKPFFVSEESTAKYIAHLKTGKPANNITSVMVSDKAKIFDFKNLEDIEYLEKNLPNKKYSYTMVSGIKIPQTKKQFLEGIKAGDFTAIENPDVLKVLSSKYDGFKTIESEGTIGILNPNIVKTHSELKAEWDAIKEKPVTKEEKPTEEGTLEDKIAKRKRTFETLGPGHKKISEYWEKLIGYKLLSPEQVHILRLLILDANTNDGYLNSITFVASTRKTAGSGYATYGDRVINLGVKFLREAKPIDRGILLFIAR